MSNDLAGRFGEFLPVEQVEYWTGRGYAPMAEYNREDALVYGDRNVWAWVAGMISEGE